MGTHTCTLANYTRKSFHDLISLSPRMCTSDVLTYKNVNCITRFFISSTQFVGDNFQSEFVDLTKKLTDAEVENFLNDSDADLADNDDDYFESILNEVFEDEDAEDDAVQSQDVNDIEETLEPLGLKNFILAASDGLVLNFHIYTGKGSVGETDMKEFGLGASIVKLLTNVITEGGCVYTDRFFTSVKCVDALRRNNIYQTGTVMKNRIGPVIKKFKDDRKMKRGEWEEWVRDDDGITAVKWKDNKGVLLLSSYVGVQPEMICQRWSKEQACRVALPQPSIVNMYNRYMGGVDLCDRYISLYRCYVWTNKWTVRAFNHFVDLVIINCWIMHKRQQNIDAEKKMTLLEFKVYIGKTLIGFSSKGKEVVVRNRSNIPFSSQSESSKSPETSGSAKRRKVNVPLTVEERYNCLDHFPQFIEAKNASKCRAPGCSSRTRTICIKCKLYLCTNDNNCFLRYHKKQ